MRHLLAREELDGRVEVESAGTGSWHVGGPPDRRATAEARNRGIVMEGRARQFRAGDFDRLDLVVAMDAQNAADLRALAPDEAAAAKVRLLRDWDPEARDGDRSVPDPYYGGPDGFATVLDMVERACAGLVAELRAGPLAGA
jgi:low molecular weight protein-tyrosine phosphatase